MEQIHPKNSNLKSDTENKKGLRKSKVLFILVSRMVTFLIRLLGSSDLINYSMVINHYGFLYNLGYL